MVKWTLRIAGGLLAFAILATVGLFIAYSAWISDYKRELEAGSRIASTPLGEIEYAVAGEGAPVLKIHGSPSGYDAPISGPRLRPADFEGFRIIAPSRPGYLRTPLSSGRTPAEQADLYAALLDELGIKRVIVHGVSGGGPSALQFAIRHPKRTAGLVLIVPLLQSKPELADEKRPSPLVMTLQDFVLWVGGEVLGMGPAGTDRNDPVQQYQIRAAMRSLIVSDLRITGRENDRAQFWDLGIDDWPLEAVSAPTLILHGTDDKNAPYQGSVRAATRIPNAELVTFDGGEHTVFISRAGEVHDRISRFTSGIVNSRGFETATSSHPDSPQQ